MLTAKPLAAQDGHVVLVGGYGIQEEHDRVALLELGDGTARRVAQFRLGLDPVPRSAPSLVDARDDMFHIVRNGVWDRLSVAQVVDASAAA